MSAADIRPMPPLADAAAEFRASRFWRLLPAGMRRRWWLFRPFDALVRRWPGVGQKRGVLVIRMDGIGDMVLFRRALDHYAEALGVARDEITVIGCRSWAGIADEVFAGYRVIAIDEHRFARRPLYRLRTALEVRRLNAAVAVNDAYFRRALMADSLAWLSAAPRVIASRPYVSGKTRAEYTWFLGGAAEVIDTGPYPIHEVERHFRFVSALAGREIPPEPPEISWRDAPPPPPLDDGAPYLVLNPGSNEPGRRWPFAGFAAVARRALESGLRVVLVGSPSQRPSEPEYAELVQHVAVVDLTGKTSLPVLLDVLRGAAAVLTNDTGPAHLAIALGAPTLVVVGGGHFGSFVPYAEAARPANARFLFHRLECYHCFWACHKRTDPKASFPCVAAVEEAEVWREIKNLLHIDGDR